MGCDILTRMTDRHRFIIWGWIAIVVVAGVYAPWETHNGRTSGYHLIFAPPSEWIHVDLRRLIVEWIIATAIAVGLYFAWPARQSIRPDVPGPDVPRPDVPGDADEDPIDAISRLIEELAAREAEEAAASKPSAAAAPEGSMVYKGTTYTIGQKFDLRGKRVKIVRFENGKPIVEPVAKSEV